jgi:hypothetical protein
MKIFVQNSPSVKEQTETFSHTLSNGNTIVYRLVNGTAYHNQTATSVIEWLEASRERRQRFEFEYGDTETGQSWGDKPTGSVGRSTGKIKIPLVIYNARSMGGGALLDHCIVRIRTAAGKHVVYQHPKYQPKVD